MTTDTAAAPAWRNVNRFHLWACLYVAMAFVGNMWLGWSTAGAVGFLVIGNLWWVGGELIIEMRRLSENTRR